MSVFQYIKHSRSDVINVGLSIYPASHPLRPHFDDVFRRGEYVVHRRNRNVCPCREELRYSRKEAEVCIKAVIASLEIRTNHVGDRLGIVVVRVQMRGSCIPVNEIDR